MRTPLLDGRAATLSSGFISRTHVCRLAITLVSVTIAFSIGFVSRPTIAQTLTPSIPVAASPSASPTQAIQTATAPAAVTRDPEIEGLRSDYRSLSDRLEAQGRNADRLFIFITILFAIGGFTSIFGWMKTERRATEAHVLMVSGERALQERASETHGLMMRSERVSQERDESIFTQSQRTLTLVNATLELAKEASARASRSLANRLKKSSRELDAQCSTLLKDVEAFKEDKNVVADNDTTSRIHNLGIKVKALENNLIILEDEAIELEPFCCAVSGLDSYLHDDYDQAIAYLAKGSDHKQAPDSLKSLAFYWLGYINNNLRLFTQAIHNFEYALALSASERRFELKRLLVESRFFNRESSPELINQLQILLAEFDKEFPDSSGKAAQDGKRRIITTLGNLCFQTGNETGDRDYYVQAKKFFEQAGARAKWSSFGLAETLHKLCEYKMAKELFAGPVMKEADREFLGREELRTKILAKTTQLICCIRLESSKQHVKDQHDALISLVANLGNRLTIYSQLQRRNVSKEDFIKDVDALLTEAR
jgi:hypothetical protein